MQYFKFFPQVPYTFDVNGTDVVMDITNPTTRIKIMERLKQHITVLYDYVVEDGERPDVVAVNLYGSPIYTWIILVLNNIYSLYDWVLSEDEFVRFIESKYGSISAATASYIYRTVDGYRVDYTTWAALAASDRLDPQTLYDWEAEQNEAKRRIQVMPPEFAAPLMTELKRMFV